MVQQWQTEVGFFRDSTTGDIVDYDLNYGAMPDDVVFVHGTVKPRYSQEPILVEMRELRGATLAEQCTNARSLAISTLKEYRASIRRE